MDFNKMKVNDLKAELASRNLDTKGVKAVLVERLKEAIEKETADSAVESTPIAVKKPDLNTQNQSTPVRRSRRRSMTRSPSPVKTEVPTLDSVSEVAEHEESTEAAELSSARKKRRTRSITKSPSPADIGNTKLPGKLDALQEELETSLDTTEGSVTPNKTAKLETTPVKQSMTGKSPVGKNSPSPPKKLIHTSTDQHEQLPSIEKDKVTNTSPVSEEKPTKMPEEISSKNHPENSDVSSNIEPTKNLTSEQETEVNATSNESLTESDKPSTETEREADQNENGLSTNKQEPASSEEPTKKDSQNKPALNTIDFVAKENEPDINEDCCSLSWFDSHLNLDIDPKTFDNAKPISEGALALTWAGARANLGVTGGKVAYEVLLTKCNETRQVTDEPITSAFRVGWSTTEANLELGEANFSFAYESDGTKGTDSKFTEYGIKYTVNDVIGVHLDVDQSPCRIEFTVNGISQGVAFEFEKETLQGQALYPHVCSRNIAFKINFGQCEKSLLSEKRNCNTKKDVQQDEENKAAVSTSERAPATETEVAGTVTENDSSNDISPETKPQDTVTHEIKQSEEAAQELQTIKQDFIYIAQSPKENLVHGVRRPANREDCEVIFLIGMPGSGKTHWVQNYVKEQENKSYTILSVDTLLNQMKVQGNCRSPSNTENWSKLVQQLSKSLLKLNEIATKRRRNYILDQTNVFSSEQKRRLRGFGGYGARKAVVVVPSEEEYNRRFLLKQETFGDEVQEGRINVMKAHFSIPSLEQGWFTEMSFIELDEEQARESVKKLNEMGKLANPRGSNRNPQQRRGGANHNQRWNQNYGNNRGQQYQQGGYNTQRYNTQQQYSQNQSYRPGNGYGRRDSGSYNNVSRYGNYDWTRNNSGRFDNRFANRGYQNNQNRRSNGNRGDYRGYNTGSGWNQQNSNCWSYGSQNNDTQQWYSWWQQQGSSGGSDIAQQNSMEQYWSQYAQQHNYGNYHQSKSHGSGSSSKNK